MKFELKTENDNISNSLPLIFRISFVIAIIIITCDFALKLGVISRQYQIYYNCSLISVEKSKANFKKLSRLSNLKSKQRIWEFCREFVK